MGDSTPGDYLERVKRSKRKSLGIGALNMTDKEFENYVNTKNTVYFNANEQKKKELRAKANT